MAFVRVYTGDDGQSHFEDMDLLPAGVQRSAEQAAALLSFAVPPTVTSTITTTPPAANTPPSCPAARWKLASATARLGVSAPETRLSSKT